MLLFRKYDYLVAKYDEVIRSPVDSGDGKVGLRIIGDELKSCIQSMESKRDQMIILKQIISNNLITKKESGLRSKEDGSKGKGISSAGNRKKQDDSKRRPPSRGNASLGLLKNSLVVQNALARAN